MRKQKEVILVSVWNLSILIASGTRNLSKCINDKELNLNGYHRNKPWIVRIYYYAQHVLRCSKHQPTSSTRMTWYIDTPTASQRSDFGHISSPFLSRSTLRSAFCSYIKQSPPVPCPCLPPSLSFPTSLGCMTQGTDEMGELSRHCNKND